jgi:hypothetical protein
MHVCMEPPIIEPHVALSSNRIMWDVMLPVCDILLYWFTTVNRSNHSCDEIVNRLQADTNQTPCKMTYYLNVTVQLRWRVLELKYTLSSVIFCPTTISTGNIYLWIHSYVTNWQYNISDNDVAGISDMRLYG